MYEYLDKVLKKAVKDIYRVFRQYRQMPFDEVNIIADTREMYDKLIDINRRAYRKIADYYYRVERGSGDGLHDLWLEDFLSHPSATMKYAYTPETYRKRDRLMESVVATKGLPTEYDKAMRYWVQMLGWFAVEVADGATLQARKDNGNSLVRWVSENDNRVCSVCSTYDGKIYSLAKLPPKPHPNCRCWTVTVLR